MTGFEAIGVAALMKGVDFLYGEAKELLKANREAKKKRGEIDKTGIANEKLAEVDAEVVKQSVINANPAALKLQDFAQEVEHCIEQIHKNRSNKRLLENQLAQYGGFEFAPLITQNQIRRSEEEIVLWTMKLKDIIENVYGRKLIIQGLD